MNKGEQAFFALLRAGLWEQECRLLPFGSIDFDEVRRLAEEQSVVGLITAGLEHVKDMTVPKEVLLQFIGQSLQLEHQNKEMNTFIEGMVDRMRKADIYTLLVKGQGIAQCYERPLWRASGDVDFYLNDSNYEKAKVFFRPHVDKFDPDNETTQHINMHYDNWIVELHANQYCTLSARVNRVMDEIHRNLFYEGNVRSWKNGDIIVYLPSPDNDVFIIFVHFLNHFYKGGIGLRQICDWCRLLWTYREEIDHELLEMRLRKMGLMTEWRAFGAFAVDSLGMPAEAMPLYSPEKKWSRKAERICSFIMEVGNFGHNRDSNYFGKYPFVIRKAFSLARRCSDLARHARIFPLDSLRFFPHIVFNGLLSAARGE